MNDHQSNFTSQISPSQETGSDQKERNRIGPWEEDDLPTLDDFEPDTNFVVRAAAGSGKTTALVARMVALVRQGTAEIQDLAAITFTRKAASEMKQRLYEELRSAREVLRGEKETYEGTEAETKRVDQALSSVQQCFVGTVHAFCGRLLREHALEAGLPPDFAVGIDERDEADLRSRVWERRVEDAYQKGKDSLSKLREVGLRPNDLTGLFKTVSDYPELDLYTNPPSSLPDLDGAVETAKAFVQKWQACRPEPPIGDRGSAQEALDQAEGLIENGSVESAAEKVQLLEILEGGYRSSKEKGNVRLKAWREKGSELHDAAGNLKHEAYPDLIRSTIGPVLRKWRAHVHKKAIEFVKPAERKYREVRREEGLLTHHDVLYHTRNLLRDHPEVRQKAYERTPRLLVDEFQDTDPLQAEILFYLTAGDPTTKNWTECVPKPGSLFIVGDDKQSIYRFRRADINMFNKVEKQVEEKGGEEVILRRNFRSYEEICGFCDDVFSETLSEAEREDVQAEYKDFISSEDAEGRDEHARRRLKVDYIKGNPPDEIAADTAEQIAGFIKRALDEGAAHEMAGDPEENPVFEEKASPEDFIIITGGKKNLSIYGEALARVGVPFTITGSSDLGDSDDLKDFSDLLTCALRPADELAAVSYLQGGLCGFSDDDLYQVRRAFDQGRSFDQVRSSPFHFARAEMPEEALEALPAPLAGRLRKAATRVRRAQDLLQSKRPSLALPEIAEEAGLLAAAAHAPPEEVGSIRAGRILRALALARKRAGDGDDWAEILSVFQDILDQEVDEDGLTLESGSGSAVRIMNLHQVKGLEAPVVFLADPYPETGKSHSPTRHVRREEGDLVAPVTKETPGSDKVTHPPLGWEDEDDGFEVIEEAHKTAEKKRLVYVAATRAERLLVVSEYHHKNQGRKDGDWAPLHGHMEDVPVLTPEVPMGLNGEASGSELPAPDLEQYRRERESAIDQARRPSYKITSASEKRDGASEMQPSVLRDGEDGYGKTLGIGVHTLLEDLVQRGLSSDRVSGSKVRSHLQAAQEQLQNTSEDRVEVTSEDIKTARAMVDRFLSSSLANEVKNASRVFAEYPLSSAHEELSANDGGKVDDIRRGVIDLLYEDGAGWHIVDYKTDRVGDSGLPATLGDHKYADQVRQYTDAWENLTGEKVASADLWFADSANKVDVL
ncbi:UvrD-helicase domain-containing protein [Salinibacter ruber]|uniref:UvrD-helicase domain-containing protein n=1 Tax=Salinibacter ruber TaxID=146919 RepID=UPI000E577C27|nr:UvrD-helicase domain-containing protein [Salinibacter ruber]